VGCASNGNAGIKKQIVSNPILMSLFFMIVFFCFFLFCCHPEALEG